MKKAYVKPEIELESFQFSANVAGDCDFFPGRDENGWEEDEDYRPFADKNSCQISDDGFCYQVPLEGQKVFNS